MAIAGAIKGQGLWYPFFHLSAGGLFLGAFFMATDWVTSPVTKLGRILFGIGCGMLVVLIRLKGGYPEGVAYSILLMNVVTPLIDRYTRSRVFGGVKSHA
jgi:electron transport complex protein RnfD